MALEGAVKNFQEGGVMSDPIQITVVDREGVQSMLTQAAGQDTLMQVLFEKEGTNLNEKTG